MIFQVVEFPEPDRSTPEGQLEFVFLKLNRLRFENDPAYQCAALGDPMPIPEQIELLQQMIGDVEKLRGWIHQNRWRAAMIKKQLAMGALPWLAIKHVMLERGYTHVVTQGGPVPLATWEGPYGNGIPAYYHGLMSPEKPDWFFDCDPDHADHEYLYLGGFQCVKLAADDQLVGCIDCGNQIDPQTEGHFDGAAWHCGCAAADNLFGFLFHPQPAHELLDQVQAELFELRMITQEYTGTELHSAFIGRLRDIGPTAIQTLVRDHIFNRYNDDTAHEEMHGEALATALLEPLDLNLEAARGAIEPHAT